MSLLNWTVGYATGACLWQLMPAGYEAFRTTVVSERNDYGVLRITVPMVLPPVTPVFGLKPIVL